MLRITRDTASEKDGTKPLYLFYMQRRSLNQDQTEKSLYNVLCINMRETIRPLGCSGLTELTN